MKPANLPTGILTREDLDRVCVVAQKEQFILACDQHPNSGASVYYTQGRLRLICRSCGMEATQVKVALASPAPASVLSPDTHRRLEAAAHLIESELLGESANRHARELRSLADELPRPDTNPEGKRR